MTADQSSKDQVLDRLAAVGEIWARARFGGYRFYRQGVLLGIVFQDWL